MSIVMTILKYKLNKFYSEFDTIEAKEVWFVGGNLLECNQILVVLIIFYSNKFLA